jgi:PKD repeat protein
VPIPINIFLNNQYLNTFMTNSNYILIDSLPAGNFQFQIIHNNNCLETVENLTINELDNIFVDFNPNVFNTSVNDIITFNNISQGANEFFWDFGDGNTSTLVSPNHIYSNIGLYTVKLIGKDSLCNIIDSISKEVIVDNTNSIESEYIENENIQLIDLPSGVYLSFDNLKSNNLIISVYNILGQKLIEDILVQQKSGLIRLNIPENKNINIVVVRTTEKNYTYKTFR